MIKFVENNKKTALISNREKVSYRELLCKIEKYSKFTDILEGDIVVIFMENREEWIYSFYSIWKKKGIVVPIDFMSDFESIKYILNDCKPKLLFCSNETFKNLSPVIPELDFQISLINVDEIVLGDEKDCPEIIVEDKEINETAVIIYTSGTTGDPKGVMLSYQNILSNLDAIVKDYKIFTKSDRIIVLLPFHHIFPLLGTLVAPFYSKSTIVFSPSMSSPDILFTLERYKITLLIGVPKLYDIIMKGIKSKIDRNIIAKILFKISKIFKNRKFSKILFSSVQKKFGGHVKNMVSGGAALGFELARDYKALGFDMLEGYGMTEMAPMITFTRPGRLKPGSPGELLDCVRVKFMDGEIVVSGTNLMKGYYNKKADTEMVVKDGWLYTGDLGYFDEKGYLFITGRKKDIIILSNGKNINPTEIEETILNNTDLISEIGIFAQDDKLKAIIVPNLLALKEHKILNINEKFKWDIIGKYNKKVTGYKKILSFFISSDELPKTRLGKIRRFMLPEISDKNIEKNRKPDKYFSETYGILKDYIKKAKDLEPFADDHIEIDLGLDSLDKIGLLVFIHNTFGLKISEEELIELSILKKLSEFIEKNKSKQEVEDISWVEVFDSDIDDVELPKSWFTHNIMKNTFRILFKLYFKIRVKGIENIPKSPFIIVANHQSFIDGLFVTMFLNNSLMKKTYFYAKSKHVSNIFLKFLANVSNVITVDLDKDLKASLHKMSAVLQKEKNIIIFPEGTRTRDGVIGEFKKTFAVLATNLNVPVLPIVLKGAFEAFPSGSKIPRPRKKINIDFLEPIYPTKDHSIDSFSDLVFTKVKDKLEK